MSVNLWRRVYLIRKQFSLIPSKGFISPGTGDDSPLGGKGWTYFLDFKDAKTVEYEITGGSYSTWSIYSTDAYLSSGHPGFP